MKRCNSLITAPHSVFPNARFYYSDIWKNICCFISADMYIRCSYSADTPKCINCCSSIYKNYFPGLMNNSRDMFLFLLQIPDSPQSLFFFFWLCFLADSGVKHF